jgi:hypothetical protein
MPPLKWESLVQAECTLQTIFESFFSEVDRMQADRGAKPYSARMVLSQF